MMQVAIVGAGIGGLTLYHALRRQGIAAAVYEAAPVLGAVGAGIAVPSNAMQVLGRLGLAADVLRRGCVLESMEVRDPLAGVLHRVDLAAYVREFGYGLVAIHRAALHDVLV